jgi:hypothetical protein
MLALSQGTSSVHVVLESVREIPDVRSTRTWLVFDEVDGPGADWAVDRPSRRSTAQIR